MTISKEFPTIKPKTREDRPRNPQTPVTYPFLYLPRVENQDQKESWTSVTKTSYQPKAFRYIRVSKIKKGCVFPMTIGRRTLLKWLLV